MVTMHRAVWYALNGSITEWQPAPTLVGLGFRSGWGIGLREDLSALLLVGCPGGTDSQSTFISLVAVLASEPGAGWLVCMVD